MLFSFGNSFIISTAGQLFAHPTCSVSAAECPTGVPFLSQSLQHSGCSAQESSPLSQWSRSKSPVITCKAARRALVETVPGELPDSPLYMIRNLGLSTSYFTLGVPLASWSRLEEYRENVTSIFREFLAKNI